MNLRKKQKILKFSNKFKKLNKFNKKSKNLIFKYNKEKIKN